MRKCEIAAMQRQPIRAFARIDHLVSTLGAVRRLLHTVADLIIDIMGQCTSLLMLPDPLASMETMCDSLTTAWLNQRILAADTCIAERIDQLRSDAGAIRWPQQYRKIGRRWCRVRGLNSRPTVYKTAALPLS
jgi:hypothetical protein